jgi:hypothetical protein
MSLRGRAFLPMWFELAQETEREFYLWHTIEHMPELRSNNVLRRPPPVSPPQLTRADFALGL